MLLDLSDRVRAQGYLGSTVQAQVHNGNLGVAHILLSLGGSEDMGAGRLIILYYAVVVRFHGGNPSESVLDHSH